MKTERDLVRVGALVGAILLAGAGSILAQTPAPAATPQPVTFTVTAVGGGESTPTISKSDVQLSLRRNQSTPVDGWARDENLYLAILIDDTIDSGAASNWNELRQLITSQPATT